MLCFLTTITSTNTVGCEATLAHGLDLRDHHRENVKGEIGPVLHTFQKIDEHVPLCEQFAVERAHTRVGEVSISLEHVVDTLKERRAFVCHSACGKVSVVCVSI